MYIVGIQCFLLNSLFVILSMFSFSSRISCFGNAISRRHFDANCCSFLSISSVVLMVARLYLTILPIAALYKSHFIFTFICVSLKILCFKIFHAAFPLFSLLYAAAFVLFCRFICCPSSWPVVVNSIFLYFPVVVFVGHIWWDCPTHPLGLVNGAR